MTEQFIHVECY